MSKATRKERAKKYGEHKSPATQIFADKDMVVKRPAEMDFAEFKILRRIQTEVLKRVTHRAGPKQHTKRLKYSRKELKNLNESTLAETSVS